MSFIIQISHDANKNISLRPQFLEGNNGHFHGICRGNGNLVYVFKPFLNGFAGYGLFF